MRPPKDPGDYSAYIARTNGIVKIWCVECERWTEIVVLANAAVTYRQNHWPAQTEDAQDLGFYCGARGCWANVEYLLDEAQKEAVLVLSNVPVRRQKPLGIPVTSAMQVRQLRMEI